MAESTAGGIGICIVFVFCRVFADIGCLFADSDYYIGANEICAGKPL